MNYSASRRNFLMVVMAILTLGSSAASELEPPAEKKIAVHVETAVPPKTEWTAKASGTREGIFDAKYACDDKTDTRWSSPPTDPQWLEINMGRPARVTGMKMLWDAPFSGNYYVQTSMDGNEWSTVYTAYGNNIGNGNTDEIFFSPTPAQFVKIVCTGRGTSLGHSLWEVDLKGPSERPTITAPTHTGSDTVFLLDGKLDTMWVGGQPPPHSVDIDLTKIKTLGGLRIEWGEFYASGMDMFVSTDSIEWEKVSRVRDGTGRFDVLMHPRKEVRYIRLSVVASKENKPVEIKEISLLRSECYNAGLTPNFLN